MSWVTNIILHVGNFDKELVSKVNEFFERDNIRGFVSLDDERSPRGWYGVTKYLEACFSAGSFNHLDMNNLLAQIRGIEWSQPEAVQLIVDDQEDYKCRLIDVFPDAQALYEQQEGMVSTEDGAA